MIVEMIDTSMETNSITTVYYPCDSNNWCYPPLQYMAMQEMTEDEEHLTGSVVSPDQCFVCGGWGHWSRVCTSLPPEHLRASAPSCHRCGGRGHLSRFCPSSFKSF